MRFEISPLPYKKEDLEPHISRETIEYHYGKHHQTYVNKLNALIEGTEHAQQDLETIVRSASGPTFNNAAQVWNHSFYWNSLSPTGGGDPTGNLSVAINEKFSSFANFKTEFENTAITLFGSGWVWLTQDQTGQLHIEATSNAATPLTTDHKPLLVCDVWEHAYYIDYRNVRPQYMQAFWSLANWDFALSNLKSY
jgi:superoxide dismutase, Fe-Mn family